MFLIYLVSQPFADLHAKFYGDRPREALRLDLKTQEGSQIHVYSDFGRVKGYISETVQYKR